MGLYGMGFAVGNWVDSLHLFLKGIEKEGREESDRKREFGRVGRRKREVVDGEDYSAVFA